MKTYLIVLALLIIILVSCKKEPETPQKPNDPTHTDTIPTPLQFQYGQLGLSDSFSNHFRCKPGWPPQAKIIGKWKWYYGYGPTGIITPDDYSQNRYLIFTTDSVRRITQHYNGTILRDTTRAYFMIYQENRSDSTKDSFDVLNQNNEIMFSLLIYKNKCDTIMTTIIGGSETFTYFYARYQ